MPDLPDGDAQGREGPPAATTATPDQRPSRVLPRGLAPLGYRDYFLFWIGHTSSNTARWVLVTASAWLIYDMTSDPLLLGLLGVARAVPAILLSPIGGVVADRLDHRRLLFATQGLALLASALIAILTMAGAVQIWHLYGLMATHAGITAFDAATRQALFPKLVPRRLLPEAVTTSVMAARTAELVGPLIGGLAIALIGDAAPFVLAAALYATLMIAFLLMHPLKPVQRVPTTFRTELGDGVRYILAAPLIRALMAFEIVVGLFSINVALITIVARDILHLGPEGLGVLLAGPAIGSIAGVVLMVGLGQPVRQGRLVILSAVAYGASLLAFAGSTGFLAGFLTLALSGTFDSLMAVGRHSVMQLAAPSELRGRIMANLGTVTRGVGPLAQTQSGVLTAFGGPIVAVAASGIIVAVAAITTGLRSPTLWRFRNDHARPAKQAAPSSPPAGTLEDAAEALGTREA